MNSPNRMKQDTITSFITSAQQRNSIKMNGSGNNSNNNNKKKKKNESDLHESSLTTSNILGSNMNERGEESSEEEDNMFSPMRYSLGEKDLSPLTSKSNDILKDDNNEANMLLSEDSFQEEEEEEEDTYQFNYDTLLSCEYEDDEEFDPFKFVACLPPKKPIRSSAYCLPPKRPDTPPITLVLDLDETLVHCSTDPMPGTDFVFPVLFHGVEYQVYVRKRPYFEEFLKNVSQMFETVVFTASQRVYADKLLDILDSKREYIMHRVFRDSCVFVDGNYLKDLEVLGRDISQVLIIDNSPQAYGYQVDNGIPIISWFDDESDRELLKLLPFLKKIQRTKDVRPIIRQKFKFKQLIDRYKEKYNR
jgi:CTD small phosphatase-like protein 2